MDKFCTITCNRGRDREPFYEFCKEQIARFTIQPSYTFFIDHEPASDKVDITLRVRLGMACALQAGIDICYIIESDDYYPANYFEIMDIGEADFVGANCSTYYNINSNTWKEHVHPTRASLYNTGFRLSAMKGFSWPPDETIFLDLKIWEFAHTRKKKCKFIPHSVGVGIKHNSGMVGGRGHIHIMPNKDPDWSWLAEKTDASAVQLYKSVAR